MSFTEFPILLELITGIVAVCYYKKYKSKAFKYFLCYIWLVFGVELIGFISKKMDVHNYWIYNIYTFFEFNLIALIYYQLTNDKISHKSIKFLILCFNIIYFFGFIYVSIQKYCVVLGSFIVSIFLMLYLKELLNSDKIISFKKNFSFWITVGFLLYYLTSIPFQTVYLIGLKSRELFYIQILITIVTHSCFIYGLLWGKKEKT